MMTANKQPPAVQLPAPGYFQIFPDQGTVLCCFGLILVMFLFSSGNQCKV